MYGFAIAYIHICRMKSRQFHKGLKRFFQETVIIKDFIPAMHIAPKYMKILKITLISAAFLFF